MKSSRILLAASALLCSTALVHAADPPQAVYIDDVHPFFTLTGTVGGVVMDLPDGGGLFEGEGANDPNDLLLGGTIGLSGTAGVGEVLGGLQGFIGFNTFATYAYGNYNKTSSFTGTGVVVMQGGAGPNLASITITTSSDGDEGHAAVSINHTNPQGGGEAANVTGDTVAPGAQDAPFATSAATGNSFQWGGVQTRVDGDGGSATAYAAVADTNGGVFIAAGNLDGLTLTQSYTTEAFYAGGDLTFGIAGQNGSTSLQGYVGPSYRYLAQRNTMNAELQVDVPEYANVADFPLFSMTSSEDLAAHYMGGIAGLQATIPTSDTTAITLGVEGGAYYTMASLESSGTYSVSGGNLESGGALPNADPGAFGPQVVTADGEKYEADTIAFAARGTMAYTMAIAPQAQLTFSGSVDYLSAVAKPAVNTSISDDNTDVTYHAGGNNDRIAWGQMVNFSGSVSLTGQF